MSDKKRLRFHFFGGFRVIAENEATLTFSSKKSKSLLAFLVINADKSFPREVLAEQVWSEGYIGDPNKCLRQELWQIRSVFKKADLDPDNYITCIEDNLFFNKNSSSWIDVEDFEQIFSQRAWSEYDAITDEDIDSLTQAINLYEGDLLAGIYDHWCLCKREELNDKYLRLLEAVLCHHEKNCSWDKAISTAKRILQFDDLREDIHYKLMLYYLHKENRAKAIKQFELCTKTLKKELNIIPNEKLNELHKAVKENEIEDYSDFEYMENISNRIQYSDNHNIIQDLSSIRTALDILSKKISNLLKHS